MKKLYSLFATVLVSSAMFSQVLLTENFSAYTLGGNTAGTGAGAPDGTDVYAATPTTNVANFPTGTKVYQAGGMAKLGTSSLSGSMTSIPLNLSTNGGNFSVSFDVKGWTSVEGPITVSVTGLADQSATYTATMTGTPETKTLYFTGGQVNSTITIKTSVKRAYIDNIVVSSGTAGVSDIKNLNANFVKSTLVNDEVKFGTKSEVKVYNMNGQLIKTAQVSETKSLDASDLQSGMYIITGTLDRKPVSQKIIKK